MMIGHVHAKDALWDLADGFEKALPRTRIFFPAPYQERDSKTRERGEMHQQIRRLLQVRRMKSLNTVIDGGLDTYLLSSVDRTANSRLGSNPALDIWNAIDSVGIIRYII